MGVSGKLSIVETTCFVRELGLAAVMQPSLGRPRACRSGGSAACSRKNCPELSRCDAHFDNRYLNRGCKDEPILPMPRPWDGPGKKEIDGVVCASAIGVALTKCS